jgi:4-hydroxyacetophenone monooxygenase
MNERPKVMRKPDDAFITRAIAQANPNVLRVALYQQTGDPALANMKVEKKDLRGGALTAFILAPEHFDEVREKAFEYLTTDHPATKAVPDRAQAEHLMSVFLNRQQTPVEVDFGYEELSFQEYSRDVSWSTSESKGKLEDFNVLIVGAGISGIAAGVQLNRLGIKYRMIDKQAGLGGTWYLNDYPEARVDISTFIYQFKFEKNYPWKSHYATQADLKEYLEHIADKYHVRENISLQTELTDASWNADSKQWDVEIRNVDGSLENASANIVISCSGLFTTPKMPDIKGIETYQGKIFHTTAWDHDYDISNKSIAIIGTGSTGCQLMPGLAKQKCQLTVYQRTPSWITPIKGYTATVSGEKRWLFDTMPAYWNWFVFSTYITEMPLQELQIIDEEWEAKGGVVNERNDNLRKSLTQYINSKFPDNPDLAAKCIPEYPPLARRLVMDNGWYDALNQENVELITEGIDHFNEKGIVTKDGVKREFDLVVVSAGFQVSKYLWPIKYKGRDGVTPDKLWEKDGARAHLGINMPGFPNFFMFYGPNGNGRGGGFHSWAEIWSRYVGGLIVNMVEQDYQEVEVRDEVFKAYNDAMDKEDEKLLWKSRGKGGYYVNKHGRSGVNMPWSVHDFYSMVQQPNFNDFDWR